ncbi:UDP-glucose 6-dehydrogenase [Roseimaritima multifibrata]|uniref:UDP-glucose 6-dehydrogenase n=1 Tax=Roseimaritima multifibrata TaxID=1930274 RepID=A0A517MPA3_9BACT|nr:UDP-glucose/GDP-mannose dehydrogenase family protein [Roseimaritima multifibrata]QDS96711.1 UDP-glucose 6-dehydrogenase [Roseimaritima multifibrata]
MKIAMIGTGYVGLVTGTCFADSGNEVACVDIDETKIARLREGKVPIYEPGLTELVIRNSESGRLTFTTDLKAAVSSSRIIYLAVGTPPAADGSADLTALKGVVDAMAPHLTADAIVVTKSTVPVGTNQFIYERLEELLGRQVDVASNPEFLKEGAAIDDFMKPDRVVVGVRRPEVGEVLAELYRPFLRTDHPFLTMSPQSAELTKYVANALLSTKISFINEMANLCEHMGGDINDVRRGIGHDSRIGFAFLFPGVGYGGSCFPKDVRALASMARDQGLNPRIMDAVDEVNQHQKTILVSKIDQHFKTDIAGKRFAIWGLAFKPQTDDIREAPALTLIDYLLENGALPQVHDPEASENIRAIYGSKLIYCESAMDALNGADALAINTEWKAYHNPNFEEMRSRMNGHIVFDGRNLYEPEKMVERGFSYHSIGRPAVYSDAPQ